MWKVCLNGLLMSLFCPTVCIKIKPTNLKLKEKVEGVKSKFFFSKEMYKNSTKSYGLRINSNYYVSN